MKLRIETVRIFLGWREVGWRITASTKKICWLSVDPKNCNARDYSAKDGGDYLDCHAGGRLKLWEVNVQLSARKMNSHFSKYRADHRLRKDCGCSMRNAWQTSISQSTVQNLHRTGTCYIILAASAKSRKEECAVSRSKTLFELRASTDLVPRTAPSTAKAADRDTKDSVERTFGSYPGMAVDDD